MLGGRWQDGSIACAGLHSLLVEEKGVHMTQASKQASRRTSLKERYLVDVSVFITLGSGAADDADEDSR